MLHDNNLIEMSLRFNRSEPLIRTRTSLAPWSNVPVECMNRFLPEDLRCVKNGSKKTKAVNGQNLNYYFH